MCNSHDEDPLIACATYQGATVQVPIRLLRERSSVYGLVLRDQPGRTTEVLLVRVRRNGKWFLPGGGIERGEKIRDALVREFAEEVGLKPTVLRHVGVKQFWFLHDADASQVYGHVFLCSLPQGVEPSLDAGDEDEGDGAWVPLAVLRPEDCHCLTYDIITEYVRHGRVEP